MKWMGGNDLFLAALLASHEHHARARSWLDQHKSDGWGLSVETILASMRLMLNPAVMSGRPLQAEQVWSVVDTELKGPHPGSILFAKNRPRRDLFSKAQGHRQIMDIWLVQLAREHHVRLATCDAGLFADWPDTAFLIPRTPEG
jgi:predicted nucleic acid-binding protein